MTPPHTPPLPAPAYSDLARALGGGLLLGWGLHLLTPARTPWLVLSLGALLLSLLCIYFLTRRGHALPSARLLPGGAAGLVLISWAIDHLRQAPYLPYWTAHHLP